MDPFISIVDLQNYMERTVEPNKAAIALDSACDTVTVAVGQKLEYVADDVVVLDSNGDEYLLLPELPVYEVTSVVGPGAIALVEGTDFELDLEQGAIQTIYQGYKFLKGRKIYTVTYTHGYVSDAAAPGLHPDVIEWPSAVRIVALQLASRIYDQYIVKQETVGGASYIYSADESIILTSKEKSILERAIGVGRRRM